MRTHLAKWAPGARPPLNSRFHKKGDTSSIRAAARDVTVCRRNNGNDASCGSEGIIVNSREADLNAESLGSSRLPKSSHSIEESQGGQDYQQNKSENRAEYDLVHRCAAVGR